MQGKEGTTRQAVHCLGWEWEGGKEEGREQGESILPTDTSHLLLSLKKVEAPCLHQDSNSNSNSSNSNSSSSRSMAVIRK